MSRSNNSRKGAGKGGYGRGRGPSWWHRMHFTRPTRRAAHVIEASLRGIEPFRPFVCGERDCEGCEVEELEAATAFPEADRVNFTEGRKPHLYYW